MNYRGANLPPFIKPIALSELSDSKDTTILIAAACVAILLTIALCVATAPIPTDDLTNFAAVAADG
jgi:hypothetical protein